MIRARVADLSIKQIAYYCKPVDVSMVAILSVCRLAADMSVET